jgi:hypothetical protein
MEKNEVLPPKTQNQIAKAKAETEQQKRLTAVRTLYPFSHQQPDWALSFMKESLNIRNVPEIIKYF